MSFKVGDRVRIVDTEGWSRIDKYRGKLATVKTLQGPQIGIVIDGFRRGHNLLGHLDTGNGWFLNEKSLALEIPVVEVPKGGQYEVQKYHSRELFEHAINVQYTSGWRLHSWQQQLPVFGNNYDVVAVFERMA